MDKILLVTAKNPMSVNVLDGGAKTVLQYIESLSNDYIVDLLHLNIGDSSICNPLPPKGVSKIEMIEANELNYIFFNNKNSSEKFERRIENSIIYAQEIKKRINFYNIVIIFHCSLAMGLKDYLEKNEFDKIVLLPMFLTPSYLKSGDCVPKSYTNEEYIALENIRHIITPSNVEKKQLTDFYHVKESKIVEIPRSVDSFKKLYVKKKESNVIKICYVASFKNQKNNLDSIKCIELLVQQGFSVNLFLVGSVFDKKIYDQCVNYVESHNLSNFVHFTQAMTTNKLHSLYECMDLAISTSLHETFGRSIFEAMSFGLPTFCLNTLEVVDEFALNNTGLKKCDDFRDMASELAIVLKNKLLLKEMSLNAKKIRQELSQEKQYRSIKKYVKSLLPPQKCDYSDTTKPIPIIH